MMTDDKKMKKQDEENESESCDCQERIEQLENSYKRALADYQNLEKRVVEEKREFTRVANRGLLLRILPILDTLIRANNHTENSNVKVSIAQFIDTLKGEGVVRIEAIGKHFDPQTMEAIGTTEGKEGEVIAEERAGYKLNEKVLRAAQVIVGVTKEEKGE